MASDDRIQCKQGTVIVHYCDGYNSHNYGICYFEEGGRAMIGEIQDYWNSGRGESWKTTQCQRLLDDYLSDD